MYSYSISLDPEEDIQDPNLFAELAKFLDDELTPAEREQVFTKTIPRLVYHAKSLKSTKPPQGLHFSLQQQSMDKIDAELIFFFFLNIMNSLFTVLSLNSIPIFFSADSVEYSYKFVSALIANAFFSTYPKRTRKTHPTLQDFNFTNFFKHLNT